LAIVFNGCLSWPAVDHGFQLLKALSTLPGLNESPQTETAPAGFRFSREREGRFVTLLPGSGADGARCGNRHFSN